MNERQRLKRRFWWEVFAEDLGEESVHDGMKSFVDEPFAVGLGRPYIEVAQPALGSLEREMDDEAIRSFVAEAVSNPPIELGINRYVLRACVHEPSISIRMIFGLN